MTHSVIANFTDQEIVKAILDRETFVTKEFLYGKCYPLFKAIYDKYYTDCEICFELINEIYVYIMIPQKNTGISKLAPIYSGAGEFGASYDIDQFIDTWEDSNNFMVTFD